MPVSAFGPTSVLTRPPSMPNANNWPVGYGWSRLPKRSAVEITTRSSLAHQKSLMTESFMPALPPTTFLSERRRITSPPRSPRSTVAA